MKIELITKDELSEIMLVWAAKENWHYSLQDVNTFFDMKGKKIYALKETNNASSYGGTLVGCICVTEYTMEKNSFLTSIGFFIVNEKYREKNYMGLNY